MKVRGKIIAAAVIIMAFALLPCLSNAGSLEPTPDAVDTSGNPVPTMKTLDQIPPTWSQRLPASERFQGVFEYEDVCYIGGQPYPCTKYYAVLDKETGLVWQKDLSTDTRDWYSALLYCNNLSIEGRKGWKLPTVNELASLVDSTQSNPVLPSGHPFTNVQSGLYWSSTSSTYHDNLNTAYYLNMVSGFVNTWFKGDDSNSYAWCVRGGQGGDVQ